MKSNLDRKDSGEIGFYLVANEDTAQVYAGSGVLGDRLARHKYHLSKGTHPNQLLQRAYDNNPNFEFIALPTQDRGIAYDLEQGFIDDFGSSPLLLNLAKDARYGARELKHSDETKEKLRQRGLIQMKDPTQRQRLREAAIKNWQDPEFRERVCRLSRQGLDSMTPERKRELSEARSATLKDLYATGGRKSTIGQTRSAEFKTHDSEMIAKKWQDPSYREKQIASKIGNTNAPMRSCSIEGIVYPSVTAAAEAFGMTKQGIQYRLETPKWSDWFYL